MKPMFRIFIATMMFAHLSLVTIAQDGSKAKTGKKMKMKEHVCTQVCHDGGKHVYVHGEKGHVCTSACKK